MIEDLSTRLGNLEYGHGQLVQRVNQVSDVEVAAGVTIGEIGPRVLVVEGQMQVMASQMIQVVDRMEQVGAQVELGQQTATQRDETITGLTQQVQALQIEVQQRHTDPAATDYCYRDKQRGEHADAVHFGIGETDCSLREKTTRTL
ncbi:hypothetical protein Tco_1047172, partial [Tanacetum coccineum]